MSNIINYSVIESWKTYLFGHKQTLENPIENLQFFCTKQLLL